MKNTFLWIIRICFFGILLVPLYVDPNTIYPFIFSKTIVFQILVEIAGIAWILLRGLEKRPLRIFQSPLAKALSIFLLVFFVSALFGIDPLRSLYGTPQWMTGLVTYLHFFAFFIILATTFREWKWWRIFLLVSVGVASIASLYGIHQAFGIDAAVRVEGPLGNPIYFSSYLMMNLFFAAYLFLKEKNRTVWYCLIAAMLFFFGTMLLTGTRGAMISFMVCLGLFLVYLFSIYAKRNKLLLVGGSALIIICVGAVVFFGFSAIKQSEDSKAASPYQEGSIQRILNSPFTDPARMKLIQIGLDGFKQRPLLGWGPNNFTYVFSSLVDPKDYGTLFTSWWYDQAHNEVLEILATMGIVGLLAYAGMWVSVWFLLWKKWKATADVRERLSLVVLGLFFLAYVLESLTSFDTVGPLIMLYAGFGFAYVVVSEKEQEILDGKKKVKRFVLTPGIVFACVAVVIVMVNLNITPYAQARSAGEAINTIGQDMQGGLDDFHRALSGNSFTNDDVRLQLAKVAFTFNQSPRVPAKSKEAILAYATSELEKSVVTHPKSLEYGLPLLTLYRTFSVYNPAVLDKGEKSALNVQTLYPARRDVLFEYAFMMKQKGEHAQAKELVKKIIDLDPTRADAHWWMAEMDVGSGSDKDVFSEIENARKLGYPIFEDQSLYIQIALKPSTDRYTQLGKYIQEAWFTDKLQTVEFAQAATIVQAKVGTDALVQYLLKWIRERDPGAAQATESLLKKIKRQK